MKTKRLAISILMGVAAAVLVVVIAPVLTSLERQAWTAPEPRHLADPARPVRLEIPALGIDTGVEAVGMTPSGNMGNPSSFDVVAWLAEAARPGELGSALLAGHLDNALGRSGVFKELDRLRPGDEIIVHTASGERLRFTMTHAEDYDYRRPPPDLATADDRAYVKLITCDGPWLREAQTYERRLVVYAELS